MSYLATLLTCAVLVSSALAAQKPIKIFPKKYDPTKHGFKGSIGNSYTHYGGVRVLPIEVPGVPSPYGIFGQDPEDPIIPPIFSYLAYANTPLEPMQPPVIDSYMDANGEKVDIIVVPEFNSEDESEKSSYTDYVPELVDYLVPPSEDANQGASSYSEYQKNAQKSEDDLSPPPEESSSYTDSDIKEKKLTKEQITSLKKENIKIPSKKISI